MKLKLYDIDAFILEQTDGVYQAYGNQKECVLLLGDNKFLKADFHNNYVIYRNNDTITIEMELAGETEDRDFPAGYEEFKLEDIMKAPCKEIDSMEFFLKREGTYKNRFNKMIGEAVELDPVFELL